MTGARRLLELVGFSERPPAVDANGLVTWGRMDADFRAKCAVYEDGRCLVADGYAGDTHVREVLRELRYTGAVPEVLREETATLEELSAVWRGGRASGGSRMANSERTAKLYGILEQAVEAEADDVFFEIGESDCRVLVSANNRKLPVGAPLTRAEGEWIVEHLFYCKNEGSKQVSIIKQDFQGWGVGERELRMPERIAALRCERGPNVNGEHLVARLFVKGRISDDMTLEKLGFPEEVSEIFREIRMSKYGGIINSGPTGEGKSTTNTVNMITQMREHDHRLNMATVEDPVENPIRGAIQIQVAQGKNLEERALNFAKALMHFVRIHPQVGLMGEIRDLESAKQALQFIDSGHQVWTTLHAHNANGIMFRLLDLGVERAQLVKPGNIRLAMNQRLMSIVCPQCCLEAPPEGHRLPAELAGMLGPEVRYRNPAGCGICLDGRRTELAKTAWAGYSNRHAFAEWIVPDEGYLGFVRDNDALGAWRYWLGEMGGITLGTKIWRSVGDGLVDPFDALAKGAKLQEASEVFGPPRSGSPRGNLAFLRRELEPAS